MYKIKKIKEEINNLIKYRKDKADTYGEVFTSFDLIKEHVSNIDVKLFKDAKSTFLDPCAGFGSYSIILIEYLMKGLKDWEPNEEKRYKHIIENQIYMIELQTESCKIISKLLNPDGIYDLNLYNMSFLDFDYENDENNTKYISEEVEPFWL